MKRVLLILTPPLVFLILLAVGLKYWALPYAENWALAKAKSYSEANLPFVIEAESVQFHFLKPSVSVENVSIVAKEEFKKYTEKLTLESLKVNLDVFQLLTGRLQVSAVLIDSPQMTLQLDPLMDTPSKPEALPLNLIFEWSEKIPVERIFLHNANLQLKSKKENSSADIQGADLLLGNHVNSLSGRLDIPTLNLMIRGQGPVQTRLDTTLILGKDNLRITRFGVRYANSELIVKGKFDQFAKVALHPIAKLEAVGDLKLPEIMQQLRPLLAEYKLPSVQGETIARLNIDMDGKNKITGQMDVETKNVSIQSFSLGNASLHGVFKGDSLSFSDIEITHPAGKAHIVNTDIELNENFNFKTLAKVNSLDAQKLFQSLHLNSIPVWINLTGELPCQGQIKAPIKVTCDASATAENILVSSEYKNPKAVIVDIAKMSTKGKVEITDKQVSYDATLEVGNNTGTSKGVIEFDKGFQISYATPRLDFANIRNLGNLKFKGGGSLEGTTQGNSAAATFTMKLKTQDFVFEDYYLGDLGGTLSYKTSHLYLDEIQGTLPRSHYEGSLDIDFHQSRIVGRVKAPTLDLSDIVKVFEAHYLFPLNVKSSGSADMSFSGPLEFWKMSYQLDARFKDGNFAGESFSEMALNAQATEGQLQIQKAFVRKGNGTMNASGTISPEKDMNIKVEGRNFRLDESDFVTRISSNIFGMLNFTSQLHGKVTEPEIGLRGSVTEMVMDEQEIPSSFFDMKIRRNLMEGNANIFGHRIQADWLLPFDNTPMRLRLKTTDWNYASLLSVLSGNTLQNEYDSSLTADIDLHSPSGQWQKATGTIQVKNLFLKRGPLSFRNPDPISIKMDNGRINIKNFLLEGPQNNIQLKGQDFTLNQLNVNLVASTELRLFQMFFPFLDDMGGSIQASTTVSGSLFKPQILGSLSTNNSFVKVHGLPHPIERIQAEVNFSQSKVLINSIRGQMAGGIVSADGSLTIRDYHDLPTSIRLNLENVNLNIPDKVRTSGSADLLISGKWFPFLLSGTYRVSNGIFEREFTDDSGGNINNTRQSVYLPKILRQSSFEALVMDIQILFEKSFLVKNSLVDGSVQGNLQVKGPISNPILLGRLQADKNTKLIFKDKSFEVLTANVLFNNPDEINPDLYISAQARVSDYDVMILAQGPAKNLKGIRLTSVPPLPEQDIISLLALGVTSARNDTTTTPAVREQSVSAGYEVGFAIFSQPLNKQFQDRLGMNVQLSSSYDTTRNISVPKVTISKKLSQKINASASRALGDVNDTDVKLRYLINQNVSAIGSFEKSEAIQGGTTSTITTRPKENVFGLDLEFRKEFK